MAVQKKTAAFQCRSINNNMPLLAKHPDSQKSISTHINETHHLYSKNRTYAHAELPQDSAMVSAAKYTDEELFQITTA